MELGKERRRGWIALYSDTTSAHRENPLTHKNTQLYRIWV